MSTETMSQTEYEPSQDKETFIPVTRFALIDTLIDHLDPSINKNEFKILVKYLSQWRHTEYHERLLRLKEYYLPFSPDRDTKHVRNFDEIVLNEKRAVLFREVEILLQQANYNLIGETDLDRLISNSPTNELDLSVDRSDYDNLLVYYRGSDKEEVVVRKWWRLFRKRTYTVKIFKRLFMIFKLKDEDIRAKELMQEFNISEKKARKIVENHRKRLPKARSSQFIFLKMFKNIPQNDLEMMFPNTQIKFKLFDKIKLAVTAGGGTVFGVFSTATKAIAAIAAANPIMLATTIFGFIGLVARQVANFFNTHNSYMLTLSQRLYFHSLADNRGALTLISDRAEEEDIKEELLLYTFLLEGAIPSADIHVLDKKIEAFFHQQFQLVIDFDIEDALHRLIKDGVVIETDQGTLEALVPEKVCRLLEEKFRCQFSATSSLGV